LGLLFREQRRYDEAEKQFLAAVRQFPMDGDTLNGAAWLLYEQGRDLEEAARLAARAVRLDANASFLHTYASIQLILEGWSGAKPTVHDWLKVADENYVRESRDDVVNLFRAVVSLGKAGELVELLNSSSADVHWLPWAEALALVLADDPNTPSAAAREILTLLK
jgi:tetratricopeptide (TPR) repeat protein